jgi:hypothetical protein
LGVGDTSPHPLPLKVPTIYSTVGGKKSTNLKFVDAGVRLSHNVEKDHVGINSCADI